jgi:hypothetical protein
MEDLKTAAWMLRYAARSLAHNLQFIPEEKRDWKPHPSAKSPLEVAGEAIRVIGMYRPMVEEGDFPKLRTPWKGPETLAEARELLLNAAEEYAALLEAAGPELDRAQAMPFGGVFRGTRAAGYPLLDVLNHHGQILYLQTLLGDAEMHWDEAAIADHFEWKGDR